MSRRRNDPCTITFEANMDRPEHVKEWADIAEIDPMDGLAKELGPAWKSEWESERSEAQWPDLDGGVAAWRVSLASDEATHSIALEIPASTEEPPDLLRWEVEVSEWAPPSAVQQRVDVAMKVVMWLLSVGAGVVVWKWTGLRGVGLVVASLAASLITIPLFVLFGPRVGPDHRRRRVPTKAFHTLVRRVEKYLEGSDSPFRGSRIKSTDYGA